MLQEMRVVLRAHRVPGVAEEDVPSPGQVLRMATIGGAATTPYGSHIGTRAVGKAADFVLIDWDKLAWPYINPETPALDAVVQRAKTDGVDLVIVAGEVVYQGGRFTRVDREAALRELHQSLRRSLADDESKRRALSKALLPHVRRFYAGYFDPKHICRPSSRLWRRAVVGFKGRAGSLLAAATWHASRERLNQLMPAATLVVRAHRRPAQERSRGSQELRVCRTGLRVQRIRKS
jgi:hypothetical protein